MIDADVILGAGVKIFNPALVNIFGCSIGDDSFIGPFVEITRGVTVGRFCKIESHSFLCAGVIIEDHVFIGHGVMFTNDSYPRTDRQVIHPKTTIKQYASLGTNSTILGGVTIGKHSIIGAGAVITKDIPDLTIVAGNPGKVIKQFQSIGELKNYIHARQESHV